MSNGEHFRLVAAESSGDETQSSTTGAWARKTRIVNAYPDCQEEVVAAPRSVVEEGRFFGSNLRDAVKDWRG